MTGTAHSLPLTSRCVETLRALLDRHVRFWLLTASFDFDAPAFRFANGLVLMHWPVNTPHQAIDEATKLSYIGAKNVKIGEDSERSFRVLPRLPIGLHKDLFQKRGRKSRSLRYGIGVAAAHGANLLQSIEVFTEDRTSDDGMPFTIDHRIVFDFGYADRLVLDVKPLGLGPLSLTASAGLDDIDTRNGRRTTFIN